VIHSIRGYWMAAQQGHRDRGQTLKALTATSVMTVLFRRVCDGGSTPVRWSRFLRCHYVCVRVGLGG
jgi:hypothetical protein